MRTCMAVGLASRALVVEDSFRRTTEMLTVAANGWPAWLLQAEPEPIMVRATAPNFCCTALRDATTAAAKRPKERLPWRCFDKRFAIEQ